MTDLCGYRFDIVVVRVDASNYTFDDLKSLYVDVGFHNFEIKVTSSRINVVEFVGERCHEFTESLQKLISSMQQSPVTLNVNYMGELIGTAKFQWPVSMIEALGKMKEVIHVTDCDLLQDIDYSKVGTISIIARIQPKCTEMGDIETSPGEDEIEELEKVINPHDVIFLVGDANKVSACPGGLALKNEVPNPKLNMDNLRPLHGTVVRTTDVLNTCCNLDCCGLRKIADQYGDPVLNKITCGDEIGKYKRQRIAKAKCIKCALPENEQNEENIPRTSNVCSCRGAGSGLLGMMSGPDGGAPSMYSPTQPCQKSPPIEDILKKKLEPTRRCPVCKANMHWLPPMSACPQCCYKPMVVVDECPCVEQLTVDEVLREYMKRDNSSNEGGSDVSDLYDPETQALCRCVCTVGRICAHCRIREACSDIFQKDWNPDNNRLYQKQDKNAMDTDEVCKEPSQEDCRPFLARVFSELKDLYDIRDDRPKTGEIINCYKRMGGGNEKKIKKRYNTGKSYDEPTTACKDIAEIRENKPHRQSFREGKKCRKTMCRKNSSKLNNRPKCGIKLIKVGLPPCGECSPLGCLPCKKKRKHPCGNKDYDYCAIRSDPPPKTTHKACINGFPGRKNVPCNMGWLWNVNPELRKMGYKPGAIRRPIRELMSYFLRDFPADTLIVSKYCYRKHPKPKIPEIEQKTTLHIAKRNDEYIVTFRPLKDENALKVCADPYLDMKPVKFKITKDPLLVELSKLKRCLKKMGFTKCTCHQPVIMCHCRSFLEKKRLEFEINKECRKRKMPSCGDKLVLSDSSDSDAEYDFGVTPPAGIVKRSLLYKPDYAERGTQYNQADWDYKPLLPYKLNKYAKNYKCATGEQDGADDAVFRRKGKGKGKGKGGKGGGTGGGYSPGPKPAQAAADGEAEEQFPKSAKYMGKDGKFDMMKYLKMNKMLTGAAAAEARRRRLAMLKEMAAPPFDSLARKGKPEPCICDPCCGAPCCGTPCCMPPPCYPC